MEQKSRLRRWTGYGLSAVAGAVVGLGEWHLLLPLSLAWAFNERWIVWGRKDS